MSAARRRAALAQAFMAAPLENDGWDRALRELARQTHSAYGQLLAIGGPNVFPFGHITDEPSGAYEEYVAIDGGNPDINWRIACVREPFKIMSESDYEVAREGMRSDPYDELMDRYDMSFGCQTVLLHERDQMFGLSTMRNRSDGKTRAADRQVFAEAAPLALGAIRMQQALEHQGTTLIAGALGAMDAAAIICDRLGHVRALTAAAEERLRNRRGLRLANNQLSARWPDEDREFQRALGEALSGAAAASHIWLRGDAGPLSGQTCEIFALPKRDWNFGFQPRALVTLREPTELGEADQRMLAQIFGLSPAEAEVSLLAARGAAREEIALQRNTSAGTVNAQLKNIFHKTNVRREAELVALINKLAR